MTHPKRFGMKIYTITNIPGQDRKALTGDTK